MDRKTAHSIINNEKSARSSLVRSFLGCHSLTVAEALVIWAQLEDCPHCLRETLDSLRKELGHLPEFKKKIAF